MVLLEVVVAAMVLAVALQKYWWNPDCHAAVSSNPRYVSVAILFLVWEFFCAQVQRQMLLGEKEKKSAREQG
jgi:hypothetical protein